jgi:hypothetical protein
MSETEKLDTLEQECRELVMDIFDWLDWPGDSSEATQAIIRIEKLIRTKLRAARAEAILELMGDKNMLAAVEVDCNGEWDVKVVADRISVEDQLRALAAQPTPAPKEKVGE